MVVEDINQQLSQLGKVSVGERDVLLTPHLAHLFTPIAVSTHESIDMNEALQALHPTPALACSPRKDWKQVMSQLQDIENRGHLGAPFVVSFDENTSDVVVAIRHINFEANKLSLPAGCGVVDASEQSNEWNELKKKRESVKQIFGVQ